MAKVLKKCDCRNQKRCPHSYVVRYRMGGRGSPQRERSFSPTRYDNPFDAASRFAKKIEGDKATYVMYDPAKGRTTVQAYGEQLLDERELRDSTARRYRSVYTNHVFPSMGHRSLADVRREDIRALVRTCRQSGLAPATVEGVYIATRMLFSHARIDGLIQETPCTRIELPEIANVELGIPTDVELRRIESIIDSRFRPVVRLMAGCGLRPSEALAANERCIQAAGTVYRVGEQVISGAVTGPLKHRRAGQYRDSPLPEYVLETLAETPTQDGYYVPGRRTAYTPYGVFLKAWRRAAPDFDPRGLRHRFASVALAEGVPITDVSEWLGHRNIQTTYGTYRHLVPHAMDRARAVLSAARWDVTGADSVLTSND